MIDFLTAVAQLFDVLLAPFTEKAEDGPVRTWVKITGIVLAVLGVGSVIGLIVWGFLPANEA